MRIVVMGVTGCGKTTVGRALAGALGLPFMDADDLHPAANVAKMAAGLPLDDADRWPWLADVAGWLAAQGDAGGAGGAGGAGAAGAARAGGVIACSALKRAYRDAIREAAPDAVFVHLVAPQVVLERRIVARQAAEGHFAGAGILGRQFADLEPLEVDEDHYVVDVSTRDAAAATAATQRWLATR